MAGRDDRDERERQEREDERLARVFMQMQEVQRRQNAPILVEEFARALPETWAYDPTALDVHKQAWLLTNAVLVGYKDVAKADRLRLIEDLMGFCQKMTSVSTPQDAPPCVMMKLRNFSQMSGQMSGKKSKKRAERDDDSDSDDDGRKAKSAKTDNKGRNSEKPKWEGCFLCKDKGHRIADCPLKKLAANADALMKQAKAE